MIVITDVHLRKLAERMLDRSDALVAEGTQDAQKGDTRLGAVKITKAASLTAVSAELIAFVDGLQG